MPASRTGSPPATCCRSGSPAVLAVVYLVFNEGYADRGDPRGANCRRGAIRLGRVLHGLMPAESEVRGLLALMLLHDARRAAARTDATGGLVPLEEQDRTPLAHRPDRRGRPAGR